MTPFRTHFSGLMLPKLYNGFRCKVAHSFFVALNSIQCLSRKRFSWSGPGFYLGFFVGGGGGGGEGGGGESRS